ncbi:hypothetical protein [Nibribacter ruber]|nr:hypothetical protein [Nibribacter ruber]
MAQIKTPVAAPFLKGPTTGAKENAEVTYPYCWDVLLEIYS